MALTINQAFTHASADLKAPSTYATAEEVRMANTIQSIISGYYRWHWLAAAATNISVSSTNQDITMAAGDQNTVLEIQQAHLLEGTTPQPPLLIYSDSIPDATTTTGQPWGCALLTPTTIRLYPAADASYTFVWRKYARPVIFTANSESFQIPEAFTDVAKAGLKWQLGMFADDDRAPAWEKTFYELLRNHKRLEQSTTGRMRG